MPLTNETNINYNTNTSNYTFETNEEIATQSAQTVKTPQSIVNNTSVELVAMAPMIESTISSGGCYGIPVLAAPQMSTSDLTTLTVNLDLSVAANLGIGKAVSFPEFVNTCLDGLEAVLKKGGDSGKGVGEVAQALKELNLDGDGVEFLCLLLTQNSKAKLVDTLKNALTAKTNDRKAVSDKYIAKENEVAQKNVDNSIAAAEQKRKRKGLGIFKAILGIITAVVTTVVSVAISVASFGAATPVGGCLIAAAVVGAAAMVASSSMELAVACNDKLANNPVFKKAMMGLSISGAILGLASSIGGMAAGALKAAKAATGAAGAATTAASAAQSTVPTLVKGLSTVITAANMATQGAVSIYEGVSNLELAKKQRELAELNIQLQQLDKEIEMLTKFIESVEQDVQAFITNILQDMEKASALLNQVMSAELQIAEKAV